MENSPIILELFILEMCPYCIKARRFLDQLLQQEKYKDIQIKIVDERKERAYANQFNYYLVPSFYFQNEKLFEGAMRLEDVQKTLDKALELHQAKSQ
jgi:glutaredoxin